MEKNGEKIGGFGAQTGMLKQWSYKCRGTWSQKRVKHFKDCEVISRQEVMERCGMTELLDPEALEAVLLGMNDLGVYCHERTTKNGCSSMQFQELNFRAFERQKRISDCIL